ncbi:MAG TPA: hypothetical protein VFH61_05380 [Thermoleophilia bacterium]|nr:hypothetical protein [Thermoleophilia bacterium]
MSEKRCPTCSEDLAFVACWDDDQITDHAYNVYQCLDCGLIMHDSVAVDPGVTLVFPNGKVVEERAVSEEATSFPLNDPINNQVVLLVALSRPDAYSALERLGCTHLELRNVTGKRLRLAAVAGDRVLRLKDVNDDEEKVAALGFDRQVDTDELTFVIDWAGPMFDSNGAQIDA